MADAEVDVQRVMCFVCNAPAVRKRIYCGDCKLWSHRSCAEKKKCCCTSSSEIPTDTDVPNAMKNLVATISSLTSTVADMKKCIDELITENKKLRKDIENLKSTHPPDIHQTTFEEATAEAVERIRRSNNVIIRGIPEPTGDSDHRKQSDLDTVKNVASTILPPDDDIQIISVIRLGKFNATRTRPTKVIFSSSFTAKTILRNKTKLSGSRFEQLKIQDDKTPTQQQYLRDLRAELAQRSLTEDNLTIKYIHGIAKITKNLPPRIN